MRVIHGLLTCAVAAMLGGSLVTQCGATEFFVEKGGNDNNPGSRMQPFKTLGRAAEALQPGDVCTVSRGLYRETLRPQRSGKSDQPIRFQAAVGESVTIGGLDESPGWRRATGAVYRAVAEGVIQMFVDDEPAVRTAPMPAESPADKAIWWDNPADHSIYLRLPRNDGPESHVIELQSRVWGIDAAGLTRVEFKGFNVKGCGVNLTGARLSRLENCHVWWAGSGSGGRVGTNDVPPSAVVMGGKENEILNGSVVGSRGAGVVLLPDGVNNRVMNLMVRGRGQVVAGNIGILAQGTSPTIRNVTVMDCPDGALVCRDVLNARIEYNDFMRTGAGVTNVSLVRLMGDGRGTMLTGNWIHDNASVGGAGIRFEGAVENYILKRNVIWGQAGAAILLSGQSRYDFIFNNTCVLNGCGIDVDPAGLAGEPQEIRVINNILAGPAWPSREGKPPATATWKCNYRGATPVFVDETNRNFALVEGSPCIDAGQEEPEFTDEFTGERPDIGAYEFGKESPQPGCHATDSANKVAAPTVKLVLESATEGAEIRYTLDGRMPDVASPLYIGPVTVVYGAVVRAKAFRIGMEESAGTGIQMRRVE